MNKIFSWTGWIFLLLVVLLGVILFSLLTGSVRIPFNEIFDCISNKNSTAHTIIFNIRLPRIILGLAVGGALSIAGVLLQGLFRNSLVEPYTLGISGGAVVGVSLSIVLRLADKFIMSLPLSGFLGALAVIILIYILSTRSGILHIQGLLLMGVMISFICSSLLMFLMTITKIEELHRVVFWMMGSLDESNWAMIIFVLMISILGLFMSYVYSIKLNALAIGEEEAIHLGVNVENLKKVLLIISSVLTGVSVSVSGIIGFVGLVVPHFARMFIGTDHRILLICSYLLGSIFLIICDTLARSIIPPTELPVGVITGILGGVIFIYALTRRKVKLGK